MPYREVDVSRDPAAGAEMVRLSGQEGVPVTVIGDQVIVGFDRHRLDEAMAEAQRPRLGAAIAAASTMAAQGRTAATEGAYLGRVRTGGTADRAGLSAGDVITTFGGRPVRSDVHLEQLLAGVQPGQRLAITFVRDGQSHQTTLEF